MIAFILRRLAQSVIVMLAVGFVAFSLFTYVGDPVAGMVGQDTTREQREQLREGLGLNDPFPVQFARFAWHAAHGDFGISYQLGQPVGRLIRERLPATLELSLTAALLALVVGVPMGVYTGLHRESWLSRLFLTISLIGVSLPTFLIGILLIMVFSVWDLPFLKALIMPSITLGLFQMTLITRLVRAEMLEVMRTDYIKFARARGLPNRVVHFGHALKNTLVPVITITGLQLGSVIAFAIITETVFQWPGMGLMFIQAVGFADVPIMAAYLMLIAFFFVVINLIVDLLYYVVDPRLRADRAVAAGHG
jgi:peptide/nickel transport system permease protein